MSKVELINKIIELDSRWEECKGKLFSQSKKELEKLLRRKAMEILNKAEKEDRFLSSEEQKEIDKIILKIDKIILKKEKEYEKRTNYY